MLYCGGAEKPRDAGIPHGGLTGVYDAMPYLVQQNRRVGAEPVDSAGWPSEEIWAGGKHVVVVGGGDTASDCVGTAFRQGAVKVTQLDIRPQPPKTENKLEVWPYWATKMRTSSSQAEGAIREFQVATLEFTGEDGHLTGVKCAEVDARRKPIPGTEFVIKADLAFIAIGFAGPMETGVLADLGERLATTPTAAATSPSRRTTRPTGPRSTSSTSPATCAAASRWSSGRSARAARPRARSTSSLMGATTLPR